MILIAPPGSSRAGKANRVGGGHREESEAMNSTIRLGYFYRTLPLMTAQRHGFYRRHGLEVQEERVRSSTQQFEYLLDGRYDVVQTSPDNVANYRYNTGHALGDRIDVQGFLGMDYGLNLVLVARPGIRPARTLKAVAVDATDSGFAYVLYAILERAGLKRGKHYDVVPVGGVSQRFQRLLSGDAGFDATLLSGGFETRAANSSYRILGSVREVADPYVGAWAVMEPSKRRKVRCSAIPAHQSRSSKSSVEISGDGTSVR
jgi:hypothetical protein